MTSSRVGGQPAPSVSRLGSIALSDDLSRRPTLSDSRGTSFRRPVPPEESGPPVASHHAADTAGCGGGCPPGGGLHTKADIICQMEWNEKTITWIKSLYF
ncbi:hypothetical protein V5799_024924 [Amblyomma americanum]|uniref:Uncharacterized protein n=1 Tax=Amblyomma americanum TaxID=6943 RepID=A0AAQ4EB23_AMBAM